MFDRLQAVFASLRSHDVRYVGIGGVAAVLHGVPQATFDLDILIEATPQNAERLLSALRDARFGTAALIESNDLLDQEITVFNDLVRIDVQTLTPGVDFGGAWTRRRTIEYAGSTFFILSRKDLIASKLASGRPKDLEDVRVLDVTSEPQPDDQ